jgi:4-hydroxybenzoate polyprenyltransferase
VTAIATVLALTAGRGAGSAWVMLAILAGQLFVGWSNDYLDRGLDAGSGRVDKPVARGDVAPRTVALAALGALVAAVPLSLASGLAAAGVHLAALVSATAYNIGLKRTPLSPLPYALSFALVPAFVTLGLADRHWPPAWALAAAALIGVGGHFAQSRPDIAGDRRARVLGAPAIAGDRASGIVAAASLAAAAVVISAGTGGLLPLVAVVPALGVALARPAPAFRLTLVTAGLVVVAFVLNGSSLAG